MKKYSEELLQKLKERQTTQDYHGMKLIVKNLPDCDEKGIANLRKMFNGVKSVPCVERKIEIREAHVTADDGYQIPVW